MSLEHAILGFLDSGDLTGYELKRRCIDQDVAHFWSADQAQVYRTLQQLEKRDLLKATRKRQRSRPDRKIYSITSPGRSELGSWLSTQHPIPPHKDPFLIQLFFSGDIPDHLLLDLLLSYRALRQERLQDLRDRTATLERKEGDSTERQAMLQQMTLDGVMNLERAAIDWLDDCIEKIRDAENDGSPQRRLFQSKGSA